MTSSRISRIARTSSRRMIGVVLPVVLVILTVLTGLVVTQVKRGTTDERLAANARETVMLDSAVQTALRWCEWRVIDRPFNTVTAAGTATVPAWRVAANWNDANSLNFTGTALLANINGDPACVVEDATCELQPPISPTGMNAGGCNGIDSRWRKFRITARVRLNAPDLPNGWREMMAQSELRLYTD